MPMLLAAYLCLVSLALRGRDITVTAADKDPDMSAWHRMRYCLVGRAVPHPKMAAIPSHDFYRPRLIRLHPCYSRRHHLWLQGVRRQNQRYVDHRSRCHVYLRRSSLRGRPFHLSPTAVVANWLTGNIGSMAGEEFSRSIRYLGQLPSDLPHVCPARCGNAFLWHGEGVWLPSHGLGIPVLDRINWDVFGRYRHSNSVTWVILNPKTHDARKTVSHRYCCPGPDNSDSTPNRDPPQQFVCNARRRSTGPVTPSSVIHIACTGLILWLASSATLVKTASLHCHPTLLDANASARRYLRLKQALGTLIF